MLTIADRDALVEAIEGYAPAYRKAIVERILWRLGVTPRSEREDIAVVTALETALFASKVEIDRFYFDWAGGQLRERADASLCSNEYFEPLTRALQGYVPSRSFDHPYWQGVGPCSMHIAEVEAIWAPIAEADDWTFLENKVRQIRQLGEAMS